MKRESSRYGIFPATIGIFLFAAQILLPAGSLSSASNPSILFEENFSGKQNPDGTPNGWKLKTWAGTDPRIQLGSENGSSFLHLVSENNSFGIVKELNFDIREYPILRWRWKVAQLPENGDVRKKETDDQAAQIYVVFPRFPKWVNTRQVGYIWENKTPKNLQITSRKSSNTKYIVLESGNKKVGQWAEEERNVYEDYKALFGSEPPQAGGVFIMIDSDDTRSRAESFFSNILIQKAKARTP